MHSVVVALVLAIPLSAPPPNDSTAPPDTSPPPVTPYGAGVGDGEGGPSQPNVDVDANPGDGTVGAGVGTPSGFLPPGSSSTTGSATPLCSWRKATDADGADTFAGQDFDVLSTGQIVEPATRPGEVPRLGWWRTCGSGSTEFVWATPAVDINVLIAGAESRARARVPLPALNINPTPEDGSYVNLGLWLALQDPGVTSVRVDLAGVWARVTARHRGFDVDFGNGDTTTCEGFGVPIADYYPDLDTFDEGPCGYTYRLSTPEDDPYRLTVSSRWEITYTTSLGTAGSLGTMTRSITVDYDIDEVQTVGVAN